MRSIHSALRVGALWCVVVLAACDDEGSVEQSDGAVSNGGGAGGGNTGAGGVGGGGAGGAAGMSGACLVGGVGDCPSGPPQSGASCGARAGLCCLYAGSPCGTTARCTGGVWQAETTCPQPPGCPTSRPVAGSGCCQGPICPDADQICSYSGCPDRLFDAVCMERVWVVRERTCDFEGWTSGCDPVAPVCGAGEQCSGCSIGAMNADICAVPCSATAPCTDPARPACSAGVCAPNDGTCARRCAAPDTPIATPTGDRAIATLRPGDLVFSLHQGQVRAVPIARVQRLTAPGHHVVRLQLDSGAVLFISAGHPTADGRTLGDLAPGDRLGDSLVTSVQSVPYNHTHTWDIRPSSDSGTYFAGGALIGTTM